MTQEQSQGATQVKRIFEQPEDALSIYSDYAQVLGTGNELMLQFYDTIPGPPSDGQITSVRSILRATIVVSQAHARNIGRLLLEQAGESPAADIPAEDES